MEKQELDRVIRRVQKMEQCYDELLKQAQRDIACIDRELLRQLTDYYDGPDWRRDYELDERGLLPKELKRGVLSEDGVYNLLSDLLPCEAACGDVCSDERADEWDGRH